MKDFLIVWEQKDAGVDRPDGNYSPRLDWVATLMTSSFPIEAHYSEDRDLAVVFYIYGDGWVKRTAAVVGAENGYLMVYENRSTSPDSRQHIFAARYIRGGIVLPIAANQVEN